MNHGDIYRKRFSGIAYLTVDWHNNAIHPSTNPGYFFIVIRARQIDDWYAVGIARAVTISDVAQTSWNQIAGADCVLIYSPSTTNLVCSFSAASGNGEAQFMVMKMNDN